VSLCGLLFPMIKLLVKALTVDPPQPPLIRGEKSNLKTGEKNPFKRGENNSLKRRENNSLKRREKRLKNKLYILIILLISTIAIACSKNPTNNQQNPQTIQLSTFTGIPTTNLNSSCVADYNRSVDYFPNKTKIDYATGFKVEYGKNYKIVSVINPWQNANTSFSYILVQCGTPIPQKFTNQQIQIIEIPVQSTVSLATTYLPYLESLELLDSLIGISDFKLVNNPRVRKQIEKRELVDVGNNQAIDLERILTLNPDLILAFAMGNSPTENYVQLQQAGLAVAINGGYLESHPLGRAEWLKFIALFFNQEAKAEQVFSQTRERYEQMVKLTSKLKQKPTVFTGFSYNGTWYVPGGKSYAARLLADAGANYLWSESNTAGSLPLDFESVYERAGKAEFWLNVNQEWNNLADVIAEEERYGLFTAFQTGQIYNNNGRVNQFGGNDYWESGVANPDVILSDLIQIFHPEIIENNDLIYYRPLEN